MKLVSYKSSAQYPIEIVTDKSSSESIRALGELVKQAEDFYPGIGAWWQKVKVGLKRGTRKGLLIRAPDMQIAGGSVLKLGDSAKLCAFRIDEKFRSKQLGETLWDASVAFLKSHGFANVYFTMPDNLPEADKRYFLGKPGVSVIGTQKANRFRRNGVPELICDP